MSEHDDNEYEVQQLRIQKRLLTRRVKKLQTGIDETFSALCTVGAAQTALYTIWASADLECDPTDYDDIVEYVTTAIAAYRTKQASLEPKY